MSILRRRPAPADRIAADGETEAPQRLRRARLPWQEGTVEGQVRPDPAWDDVRHLAT